MLEVLRHISSRDVFFEQKTNYFFESNNNIFGMDNLQCIKIKTVYNVSVQVTITITGFGTNCR